MKDRQLEHHEIKFQTTSDQKISIFLDYIDSPANLGSIFRNADAFGVENIWVNEANRKELESNRFKRTSRSTEKNINVSFYDNSDMILSKFKGYKIGLEITHNSKNISTISNSKADRILIVLGNERIGITELILNKLDDIYHINMHGKNSSLNVSQTLGIALYEIRR